MKQQVTPARMSFARDASTDRSTRGINTRVRVRATLYDRPMAALLRRPSRLCACRGLVLAALLQRDYELIRGRIGGSEQFAHREIREPHLYNGGYVSHQ